MHRPRSYDDAAGVESSALRALSFATIRFFGVIRRMVKATVVSCPQKWVKPFK